MKDKINRDKNILFLFSREISGEIKRIANKEIPSEILYGLVELKKRGWKITVSDDRHIGVFGKINRALKRFGFYFINLATMNKIFRHDIIIVKGEFSLMTTILCRLFGKKIIYKDAMFNIPKYFWRRWSVIINLNMATAVIAYSNHQARFWENLYNLKHNFIYTMHYCVDSSFYPEIKYKHDKDSFILSVGRDPGRDYACLSRAIPSTGQKATIVTLPYLINSEIENNNDINILQNIPYDKLFELYENCFCTVVPLQAKLNYPTGIRGALEALTVGIPTIASYTPVLAEYFEDGKDIIFVDAGNTKALAEAINKLRENESLTTELAQNSQQKARQSYNMEVYADQFEVILQKVI